ncbi:MAG: UbiA family prenyltransferase [Fibrobacteria bacterium]|nr:UbiA family prenyltransferase [Fibrobacteria bacterium]
MVKSWLTLFRVPIIFSAMSNVYAGYFIGGGTGISFRMAAGMMVSALIVMAGMGLNDVADHRKDGLERPERPIPSGAISKTTAARVCIAMLIGAILWTGYIHLPAIIPVILLCYFIYLYNFVLKQGPYGPLAMAACRVSNFIFGLVLGLKGISFLHLLDVKILFLLLSLGAYIVLTTYLAKKETKGNSRERVNIFFIGLLIWLGLWALFLLFASTGSGIIFGFIVLILFIVFMRASFVMLLKTPSSKHTSKCVSNLLTFIPMVDMLAMFASGVSVFYAVGAFIFVPLANIPRKSISNT